MRKLTNKKTYDKTYYQANRDRCKAKSLEYYHIMHHNDAWRLKYNKRLRDYKRILYQNPAKKVTYNTYLRNWMRENYNIPQEKWLVA